MKRTIASLIALSVVAPLAACGSDSLSNTSAPAPSTKASADAVDNALADKLPAKIKQAGKITIGMEASYAPAQSLAADGTTIQGYDVDLINAAAARLGIKAEIVNTPFDSILVGLEGGKFDIGMSSFTINAARMAKNDMVSYYTAGTRWAVVAGNPKKFDPKALCGRTIAVQSGTTQEQEFLPPLQAACGAKPITVNVYVSQAEATASVVAGKNEATLADSPVMDYAVKQSNGKLESVGEMFDSAPYGIVVPKGEPGLSQALQGALQGMKADGTYDRILTQWGVQAGAADGFVINPKLG